MSQVPKTPKKEPFHGRVKKVVNWPPVGGAGAGAVPRQEETEITRGVLLPLCLLWNERWPLL